MSLLKESISWMKEQSNDKYKKAIDQESELLTDYIDRYKNLGKVPGYGGSSSGSTTITRH